MSKLFQGKEKVYHLHDYAIAENEDGTFEYKAWDENQKDNTFTWIKGRAVLVEDILCLQSIIEEGDEEEAETLLEVKYELEQLPKWDKSKFYGVVMEGAYGGRTMYAETGEPVQVTGEDYKALKETLAKCGVTLL